MIFVPSFGRATSIATVSILSNSICVKTRTSVLRASGLIQTRTPEKLILGQNLGTRFCFTRVCESTGLRNLALPAEFVQ
jgi:hypothetical protein